MISPGAILLEKFMIPLGIRQNKLARDIGVPPSRIHEIIHGKRRVTADSALKLGKYFDVSPAWLLGLQRQYEVQKKKA